MKKIVIGILKVYKKVASPLLEQIFGKACRFSPTCSEYAIEAVKEFGIAKGGLLTVRRLLRCNSFSSGHIDPLPSKLN